MADRVKANPEAMKRRSEIVEHPFGTMKRWMGQGYFLMKGLMKVGAADEFDGACIQHQTSGQHTRSEKNDPSGVLSHRFSSLSNSTEGK